MVAAVGSEKDKQYALHYITALHTNSPMFSHHVNFDITSFIYGIVELYIVYKCSEFECRQSCA